MANVLADTEVEFIFHKDGTNDTVVLYGELDGLFNVDNLTAGAHPPAATEATEYDGQGALMFVVAVIVVYSLSMFFIVATLLRRKSSKQSLDGQVNQYIKGLEAAREQDKMERVLRTRLRWPGNFIHFGFESYSASEADPRSDSNIDSDNVTTSDESFIEMPATTLSLDHPNITSSFDKERDDGDDDDDCNLPPVYAIPEFLRRNRRHRTGESRPTSLSKSISQTEESECLANQVSVIVCAYVDDDTDTDASDAGKSGKVPNASSNRALSTGKRTSKSVPVNASRKNRTATQEAVPASGRPKGQGRGRDVQQYEIQDIGQDMEEDRGHRHKEQAVGQDAQRNLEPEVGQYVALASFDSTPSSSINFSDTCA